MCAADRRHLDDFPIHELESSVVREHVSFAHADVFRYGDRVASRVIVDGVHDFILSLSITRREHSREATERQLRSAGYSGWTGVVLKPEAFEDPSVVTFKSAARAQIEAKGYEILVNVGDQWSDLDGGHSIASYKLPNPIYLIP